jgi:hypothetical protein
MSLIRLSSRLAHCTAPKTASISSVTWKFRFQFGLHHMKAEKWDGNLSTAVFTQDSRGRDFYTALSVEIFESTKLCKISNVYHPTAYALCNGRPQADLLQFLDKGKNSNFFLFFGLARESNSDVELAKGSHISPFLSAITSIIRKNRQPQSCLSPISTVLFSEVEVKQSVLLFFCPKELFFDQKGRKSGETYRITSCKPHPTLNESTTRTGHSRLTLTLVSECFLPQSGCDVATYCFIQFAKKQSKSRGQRTCSSTSFWCQTGNLL